MHVILHEFLLTLRRLFRRRSQNLLLLITLTVSLTLSLLSWTLFRTIYVNPPAFDPENEYMVLAHAEKQWASSGQLTREEMEAYVAGQTVFSDMRPLAFYLSVFVTTPSGNERLLAAFLSSGVMQLTGAKPMLGHLFQAEDDVHRAPPKVLLSEKLWRNSYGSDPDITGKTIELFSHPCTIIGVMPASYRFPNDQDIWLNYGTLFDGWKSNYALRTALVKLKPGVSKERALNDIRTIRATLPPETPTLVRNELPVLFSYRAFFLHGDVVVSSLILFALSLLFLTVSCANAANLMVIDFLGRRAEVATHLALGIPRRVIIRHTCWHVGIIAAVAAALALLVLPVAGPALFDRMKTVNGPYWLFYQSSWADLKMGLLFAGVSATATVITPILYLLLADPEKLIRDHTSASRGTGRSLWRRLLLAGQVALLTILGICSALLVRSNHNVGEKHWGYDAASVFECKISNLSIDYPDNEWASGRLATQRQILDEIRRRPQTAKAAFLQFPPAYSQDRYCAYAKDPVALSDGSNLGEGQAFFSAITEDYFDVIQVPFVSGRDFDAGTTSDNPPDIIINATLATTLWPHEDPIGQVLYARYPNTKTETPPVRHIVRGVVRDFQANGPAAKTNNVIYYPWGGGDQGQAGSVTTYIRDVEGMTTFREINDIVHRAEPRAAVYFPSTIKRQIDLMLNSVRMTTDFTTVFAIAAVLLCAIGVYSLTVAQVMQSAREFGIRLALGAEPWRLWLTFSRGHLITALVGVVIGVIGATQLVRVLEALLYGVNARDPFTYAAVALAILAVAVLACVPSLRRLKRINPSDCLRSL